MKLILVMYALLGLAMIVDLVRTHLRYGTRAQRKVLEDKLLKDLAYLRSEPFTRAKSIAQTTNTEQNSNP
jgi:hypothetical protein